MSMSSPLPCAWTRSGGERSARWQKPRLDAGAVNIEPDHLTTGGDSRARLLHGRMCARKGNEFLQGGDRPIGADGDQQNEAS